MRSNQARIGRKAEVEQALELLGGDAAGALLVRAGPGAGGLSFARHVAGRDCIVIRADPGSASVPLAAVASYVPLQLDGPVDIDQINAAASLLVAASAHAGRLVVVDDAAHVDTSSVIVLAEAIELGARIVLVTARRAALPVGLAHRVSHTVELGDLADDAISELAANVLGGPIEPRLIRSLTRLAGGAGDAIVDVLRGGVAAGALECPSGVWRQVGELTIPLAVVENLSPAIDSLAPEELDALDLLSLGVTASIEAIEHVAAERALVTLEARGFVDLRAETTGTHVELVDAIIGSIRRQGMGALRRRSLARRLQVALRDLGNTDPLTEAAVRLASGDELGPDAAAHAARVAHRNGELLLAIDLCAAVATDARSNDLSILLAELLTECGRNLEAETMLRSIHAVSDEERALIAMTRAVNLAMHIEDVDGAIVVLDDSMTDLDDGPWMAEVAGLRGVIELMLGRPIEALRRVGPYLDVGSGREFVEAATAAGPALVAVGRCLDGADLAQAALDARLALGDQAFLEAAGLHAVVRSFGLAESGRFAEADELSGGVWEAASDMAIVNGLMWAGVVRGRSMLDQGRYLEAARVFELAASAALDLNLSLHLRWARGGALLAFAQMGDRQRSRSALDALDSSPPTRLAFLSSEIERARAWAAIVAGDLGAGAVRLRAAAAMAQASGEAGMELLALHDLVRIGQTGVVARMGELADTVQGELHAVRIAHGLGSADGAALERVGIRFESLGAAVLAAEAFNQASWVMTRTGRRSAAERLRARSIEIQGSVAWAATPALSSQIGLGDLTQREREVATLVATGLSSKEVSARLGVSVRTVDNLLQRVYRKLDVHDRSDLRNPAP